MKKIIITEKDLDDNEPPDEFICPYDGAPGSRALAHMCPECDTPHHKECWDENGGCTAFGCLGSPDIKDMQGGRIHAPISSSTDPESDSTLPSDEDSSWQSCLGWIFWLFIIYMVIKNCEG
ncbi:MAG: hypothetical protein HOK49_01495 [Opitutae bacterium]|jgi:hypothetical protein|nr:hypothetical protein [Opitutae bacterium]MBT6461188.1 hypothetical protein [Opitutae bacterium]MBT6957483.1 hypothetical protein [Opitutae bacterium]